MSSLGSKDVREFVAGFYAALRSHDSASVAAAVDGRFDENVVLTVPRSLPYGGLVEGKRRVGRVFQSVAEGRLEVGPKRFELLGLAIADDSAVARLSFSWLAGPGAEPLPMTAVEWWTFCNGSVTRIQAYYEDTAACLEHQRAHS